MTDGQAEPRADVRSFLPRPGEPVHEYAERLRVLHRDLTLVLQAVERGLAAAADPAAVPPPVPADDPAPEPVATAPVRPRRGPRVEVLPASTGEYGRLDDVDRRRPEPPPVAVETALDEPRFHPDGDGEVPRPAPRFPARPSAVDVTAPAEPEWVERAPDPAPAAPAPQTYTVAAPAEPRGLVVTKPMLAAFAAAWLVVVALLVAALLV